MVDKLVSSTFDTHEEMIEWLNTPDRFIPERTNRNNCKFVEFDKKTVWYYITDHWDVL